MSGRLLGHSLLRARFLGDRRLGWVGAGGGRFGLDLLFGNTRFGGLEFELRKCRKDTFVRSHQPAALAVRFATHLLMMI